MGCRTGGREEPAPLSGGRPGLAAAGAAVLLAAFLLLKTYALGPALSDEGIYFYMCSRIAEGAVPYRDFFFAHPPLHLLPGALLAAAAGFSLPLFKAIPAAFAAAGGVAVFRVARGAGAPAGLAALALYLSAYDFLRASSHYTGAAEATALLAWALERAFAGRAAAAGLLSAAAGLTALYALPAAAGVGLVAVLRCREDLLTPLVAARRYAVAFAILFGGANLAGVLLFASDYLDPVFRYHLLKPPAGEERLEGTLRAIVRDNAWIAWGAPAAAAAFVLGLGARARGGPGDPPPRGGRSRARGGGDARLLDGPWGPAAAGLLTSALHLGFFLMLGRVYTFYVLPAFPGLALAGGAAWGFVVSALTGAVPRRRLAGAAVGLGAILGAEATFLVLDRRAGRGGDDPDAALRYTWRDAPVPAPVNAAVRALLWRDERAAGRWIPGVTRYLQHESRRFEAPERLAESVRRLTPDGGTIFGDSLSAPLTALLAGRRIALDEADTNSMRFRSGITPPSEIIEALERRPPAAVIASPRRGFFTVTEWRAWVTSRYRLAETYQDPLHGPHELYVRR
jgi:hypothetical protein